MNYFLPISILLIFHVVDIQDTHGQPKPWVFLENSQELTITEESDQIVITFQLKDGIHINADKLSDDNLIPTSIVIHWPEGIIGKDNIFQDPELLTLSGTETPMEVFSDEVSVVSSFMVDKKLRKGSYVLSGELYYQPCNDWKCFFPETLKFQIGLVVK